MSSNQGGIFNVVEPQGAQKVQSETTAAAAQADAPTNNIARQVEKNADHVQDVAHDAANFAQSIGEPLTGEGPSALGKLQADAKQVTDEAVAEGKRDVNLAVENAKEFAQNTHAVDSSQTYLKSGSNTAVGQGAGPPSALSNVATQLQATAVAAAGTTIDYLSAAQQAAQPHIDQAKEAVANYLNSSATSEDSKLEDGLLPASSTGIPAVKKN